MYVYVHLKDMDMSGHNIYVEILSTIQDHIDEPTGGVSFTIGFWYSKYQSVVVVDTCHLVY